MMCCGTDLDLGGAWNVDLKAVKDYRGAELTQPLTTEAIAQRSAAYFAVSSKAHQGEL
jgi:hypothetical protein